MSPRNFARVFRRETGVTPAKFVERARVDAARRCLEDDALGLDEVASRCGFASAEQLRRTFHRHLRVVPIDYRKRFHRQPASAPARAVGAREVRMSENHAAGASAPCCSPASSCSTCSGRWRCSATCRA